MTPTQDDWEAAIAETNRLQRELDITNADHIALWIDANTIPNEPMNQCASWLAVQIVEAYEKACIAAEERGARLALEAAAKVAGQWAQSGERSVQGAAYSIATAIRQIDPASFLKGEG